MEEMAFPHKQWLATPFAITTSRLVILPTPIAISLKSYRTLYAELHADTSFCEMGFGSHFPVRNWSDDETYEVIATRDIARSWEKYALGDFAVGLRVPSESQRDIPQISILQGQAFEELAGEEWENLVRIECIGYAGVRDASTTSLPPREPEDSPLPPWQEMVELRYGISPRFWGRGMAKEAAEAVMQWSVQKRGVRRFIAETERENVRSAGVLQKLGFEATTTQYWKEPSEQEWELVVNH